MKVESKVNDDTAEIIIYSESVHEESLLRLISQKSFSHSYTAVAVDVNGSKLMMSFVHRTPITSVQVSPTLTGLSEV
jgi:hypothetical protein